VERLAGLAGLDVGAAAALSGSRVGLFGGGAIAAAPRDLADPSRPVR